MPRNGTLESLHSNRFFVNWEESVDRPWLRQTHTNGEASHADDLIPLIEDLIATTERARLAFLLGILARARAEGTSHGNERLEMSGKVHGDSPILHCFGQIVDCIRAILAPLDVRFRGHVPQLSSGHSLEEFHDRGNVHGHYYNEIPDFVKEKRPIYWKGHFRSPWY